MSETNAPEPTMEEILASIRRIISEDDAPAPASAEASAAPGDPPHPAASAFEAAPAAPQDDVLELTDRVEPEPPAPPAAAPPPASLGDLDFAPVASPPPPEPPPPAPAPAPVPARAPPPAPSPTVSAPAPAPRPDEPLVGAGAAGRAADHFGALASSMAMPATGRTLEDVTRELLRPLLKEWLDQNLAAIVEARVQDEVERISRRRTY